MKLPGKWECAPVNPLVTLSKWQNYPDAYHSIAKNTAWEHLTIEALIDKLKVGNQQARLKAVETLGKLDNSKAVEPLIGVLKDKDSWVRSNAAEALGKLSHFKTVKSFLTQLANSDRVDDRKQLARILGFSTEPHVQQQLVTLLNDKSLEVRLQAFWNLTRISQFGYLTRYSFFSQAEDDAQAYLQPLVIVQE